MKRVLIVGQKFSGLTDYLDSHGIDYVLMQDLTKTKYPNKSFRRRVLADFSSDETIFRTVDSINKPFDGVINVYENYVVPTAKIAERLGLPGLPLDTAEACTDKFLMRSLFAGASEEISPDFAIADNENAVRKFAINHNFPLIIKPANLSKSLLVYKNHTMDELLANFYRAQELAPKIYSKYAPCRRPKLLMEEFLVGSIHSVDAFVNADGEPQILENVVDYQTGYDIGCDDNFHYSRLLPSRLSLADQNALRHCATIGVKALGMKNSPAHVEIIMTDDGPRIVEIGARNGGYRERMHHLANGIDIIGAALDLTFGKQPIIRSTTNDSCAVLELFPKIPGKFVGLKNEVALRGLSSLNYLSIKAKPGEFRGKSSDGYKMCAVIILHNSDAKKFQEDLDFVNQNVEVTTF
ncbi:ATP-grasp domain-containing protein [Candidatus Saccharibacteria bacterium]|nr:ATP-grasp domain-containing protein [Candidatus Saccharibacteria bacterium]